MDIVRKTLGAYRAGITPVSLATEMMDFAEERGFSDYMVPGFEHGIGMMGDEWRIGLNDGPFPYWTNPNHVYRENELVICAMQYACPEEEIGFRYENPIVLTGDGCEELSKYPLGEKKKGLIRKANLVGKPVIIATQMLESMVENRRPTRAEVADVSNAILDGTDCVMLSEESASGTYPSEAVAVMTRIARITEAHLSAQPVREALTVAETGGEISVEDLISMSVHATVKHLTPTAVITPTETGTTARRVTRFRLPVWIAGVSTNESTCQRLQFSYGVYPVYEPEYPEDWEDYARDGLGWFGLTEGLVIITQGPSAGHKGGTNRMEIIDLGRPSR